ncbi:hypothetical protein GCM10010399_24660 [Dactylosporangium fulvum]|uniref:Uncharacterized protein n=1 Tax=Dactylosporangium fulvum TaxID=53359 RepID=A0ABY5W5Z7_9ACTN|nr:hypothetical protein [Dactylosporangium fulvum]UWP85492.1 hypothetical protein Dfulv_15125 [Dactylosporangium fulvum]
MRRRTIVIGATAATAAAGIALAVGLRPESAHQPPVVPSHRPIDASGNRYEAAVATAHQQGLTVWIESDLVKRWLAGPESFRAAVSTIAKLAAQPGVEGIKIADELGYRDKLDSAEKVQQFLDAASEALHTATPGKRLLIDLLVPELGCLPGHGPSLRAATTCAGQARGQYPQLTLEAVDGYLRSRRIDVVDLSTGLMTPKTYGDWGVDQATAQRAAWTEAKRRGWDKLTTLHARKALAHPGTYHEPDTGPTLTTYLDIPREQGAAAVDVWTWRQQYQGDTYRLLDPGLRSNALWEGLLQRRNAGARLFTHLSPSSLEVDLHTDLAMLAKVFTDLFVAAGTG